MTDAAALARALTEIRQNVDSECSERLSHEEHMMGVIESVSRIARAALAAYRETAEPVGRGEGELLPCPFCGAAMMRRDALHVSDGNRDCIIHAGSSDCGLTEFCIDTHDQGKSVTAAWNRRPALPPAGEIGDLVEELAALHRHANDVGRRLHEMEMLAYARDPFNPTKRGQSYKELWEAALGLAADDAKDHAASLASLSAEVERSGRNAKMFAKSADDFAERYTQASQELVAQRARAELAEAQVTEMAEELVKIAGSYRKLSNHGGELTMQIATARRDALEAAAKVAEEFPGCDIRKIRELIAAAIRAMMEDR